DRNRSHWSTSKTPSYTKSVSWQHHQILRLLLWLEDVENAGQPVPDELLPSEDKFKEGEDTKSENKDNN
ncbi:EscU/YscU/HrcU family type III secretion system export apparatus switch protein, partial [Escherichia coli]